MVYKPFGMTDTGIEPVKTWFAAKHLRHSVNLSQKMGTTGFEPAT